MSLDTIINAIEKEHLTRVRTIRDAYNEEMRINRKAFDAIARDCLRREKITIAEAVKWRDEMLRTARGERASKRHEGVPSVSRTTAMHGAKVSLARVSCLEASA